MYRNNGYNTTLSVVPTWAVPSLSSLILSISLRVISDLVSMEHLYFSFKFNYVNTAF